MITQASDYKFVTGDLNLIQIDGGIMPLRTGNTGKTDANGNAIPRANIMRGEDIAFLLEALGERRAVTELYYSPVAQDYVNPSFVSTFTRKINYSQLNNLHSRLKSVFCTTNFWLTSTGLYNLPSVVIDSGSANDPGTSQPDITDAYSNVYLTSSNWTYAAPPSHGALERSYLRSLFYAVNNMREALPYGFSRSGSYYDLDNSEQEVTYYQTDTTDNPGPSQWTRMEPRSMIYRMWSIGTLEGGKKIHYHAYGPGLVNSFTFTRPWCMSKDPHIGVFKTYARIGDNSPTYKWVFTRVDLPATAQTLTSKLHTALGLPPLDTSTRLDVKFDLVGFYRHIQLTDHTKFTWSQQ